ncbi:galactosyltransferase-related protein [Paenibacillus puerhi]|uniref:galactosyltransferase-related protein n=1 Tax=Paenibacillus puerhi TaxID=2692622 RepID=UPI00135AE401|nr:galactosyltransferase-related protein [Paenibacillus puerhi]
MYTQVSVLIPYMSDEGGLRDASFNWVCRFYEALFPGIQLCIGELADEPFSRSKAINTAARQAKRDIFVIADSDLIFAPWLLGKSMSLLDHYGWVIPYNRIHRLSRSSTEVLLGQRPKWPPDIMPDQAPENARRYTGGLTVLKRTAFEAVQGFDERFIGWGAEDDAFACSLDTLSGPRIRLDEALTHLWHPPGSGSNPNYANNYALFLRYWEVRGNVGGTRRLIAERTAGSR